MAEDHLPRNPTGAYVYEIIVDGVVRYIGKGRGRRADSHIRIAKRLLRRQSVGEKVRRSRFYALLSEAIADERVVIARIVRSDLTDEQAFEEECAAILAMPFGQLWNAAPGGEGQSSDYLKEIFADPAKREVFRQRSLAAWARDPERKGARFAEPGSREKQSAMVREKWADPEYRAQQEASRALPRPTRKGVAVPALSAPAKERWADPAFKAKATASIRAVLSAPEYKARWRVIWTPERLKKRGEAIKAGLARRRASGA